MNFRNFITKNKKYLPHPIILAFIVIPSFFFVLYFSIKSFLLKDNNVFQEKQIEFVKTLQDNTFKKDTDKDGLFDWQERLYHTDINNKDTDGDGINDLAEVNRGTDPTDPFDKKRQEVEIVKEQKETKKSYKEDETLTKTDIVARDFFVKLMELKQSKLALNKNAQKQVIDELISSNQIVLTNKYKIDDLKISKKISELKFKNNLKKIISKYKINEFQSEIQLLSLYVKTNDKKYIAQIIQQVSQYRKLEKDLLDISVPESSGLLYLEYVNSFVLFIDIVETFDKFKDDPVLVSSMILLYNNVERRLTESSSALAFFLNER